MLPGAVSFAAAVGLMPVLPAGAASFVVNSTSDSDDGNCGGSDCTLREAINAANNNNNQPAFDTISFNFSGTSVRTFNIATALPTISEPLIIDGRSHAAGDGKPLIKLDGGGGSYDGIRANAGGSAQGTGVWLLSLIIVRFGQNGIEFNNSGGNVVSNCYIGDEPASTDLGNLQNGIRINGSDNNVIGLSLGGGGNVISHNRGHGVLIERVIGFPPPSPPAQIGTGNIITGNKIGTSPVGLHDAGNWGDGIHIKRAGNTVGGSSPGARNVISGNGGNGVTISGTSATGNVISGNFIGTNVGGLSPLIPNRFNGVLVTAGASGNVIGGSAAGDYCTGPCNVISGNDSNGVFINESGGNTVLHNVIGLSLALSARYPNGESGVRVSGNTSGNTVGGTAPGDGNVIAGNAQYGIDVTAAGVVMEGNYIGTNPAGSTTLFNASGGLRIAGSNCTIGGAIAAARNVVSGNTGPGIDFQSGTGCQVAGNFIGVGPDGASALPNTGNGITVRTLFGTTVTLGGPGGAGNVISGNGGHGIALESVGALVRGNVIGLSSTGNTAIPNGQAGVFVHGANPTNVVGGLGAAERNVISGNTLAGVLVDLGGATILGNIIGTDSGGSIARPNGGSGILLSPLLPGVPGSLIRGNTVSGNTLHGIEVRTGSTGDIIEGNLVGTNLAGSAGLPNGLDGILLGAPGVTIGGNTASQRNVISGNKRNGVEVSTTGVGAAIKGNYIGIDVTGMLALPNGNGTTAGILIDGAANVSLGGAAAGEGNVISGNAGYGVYLGDAPGATILANKIGTSANGSGAVPNEREGVFVDGPTSRVRVGAANAGNLISGNATNGVYLASGTSQSILEANMIGTDASGTAPIPNVQEGVYVDGSGNNTIGGMGAGAGNVISGNSARGVRIEGAEATGNTIEGNRIGTNATGTAALANGNHGIHLLNGAHDNLIGGDTGSARNIISGNTGRGIYLFGNTTTGNSILGNYIGTDVTGLLDVGNGDGGVVVEDAPNTAVGAGDPALSEGLTGFSSAGNLISGNVANGVEFNGMAANGTVRGNFIGTDVTGTVAIPNDLDGVRTDADGTHIGGKSNGQSNLISGNRANGIRIQGAATGTIVQGNRIGTNVDGLSPMPNGSNGAPNDHGIRIVMNVTQSIIGGTSDGDANVIAFNPGDGVRVEGQNAVKHAIRGNSIHSNGGKGIEIIDGGNGELQPPVILALGPASGTACPLCLIDVFSDSADEGRIYEGTSAAGTNGSWSLIASIVGPKVTATATNANGDTSEFSSSVEVQLPVPEVNSVSPTILVRGPTDRVLTLVGTGFVAAVTQLFWDGSPRATTVLGPGLLEATILAADLQVLGDHTVRIANPGPGGGSSGVLMVRVRSRTDANCDLAINPADVVQVLRVLATLVQPGPDCAPDADGDSQVAAIDALFILRVIAGLEIAP
ncbi:hypothetical protein AYO38_04645 [bacterium SCGC AG-212-C10]|nr:hypothetical protein AYO38_04645 [bacterium SCGC AG-212-C10]